MAYDQSFQSTIFPLLFESFDTYLASIYSGRLYYQVAPEGNYPKCIYQSQDKGGKNIDKLDTNGWKGLITFRSIDRSMANAHVKLKELNDALPNLTVASGYSISVRPLRPIDLPVEKTSSGDNIYTAGLIVEINIHK